MKNNRKGLISRILRAFGIRLGRKGAKTPPTQPPIVPSTPGGFAETLPRAGADAWSRRFTNAELVAIEAAASQAWLDLSATEGVPGLHSYGALSRADYEQIVKPRHNALQSIGLAALVSGSPRAITRLESLIASLVAEPTWAAPWHDGDALDPGKHLELEGAEVALDLAVCLHAADNLLQPSVSRKAWAAIEERVLAPYEDRRLWANAWDRGDNWTAHLHSAASLCASLSVSAKTGVCSVSRARAIHKTAETAMQIYLGTAYTRDGYCLEGASYWSLGFGALLTWLELSDRLDAPAPTWWQSPTKHLRHAGANGIRLAGQRGTAPAFGDCIEGYRFPADLVERCGYAFGPGIPEWPRAKRFQSLSAAAAWILLDTSAAMPMRSAPPSGRLYDGVARLRTITASNKLFELWVSAVPFTDLAHDQQAVGVWALHCDGKPVAGDPGYPKPGKGSFGKARFELEANTAAGHPVVVAIKEGAPANSGYHLAGGALQYFDASVSGGNQIEFSLGNVLAQGVRWSRAFQLTQDELIISDEIGGSTEGLRFVDQHTYPHPKGVDGRGAVIDAGPGGFKGGRTWVSTRKFMAIGGAGDPRTSTKLGEDETRLVRSYPIA